MATAYPVQLDEGIFARQRAGAAANYANESAANQYARQMSQQRFARGFEDLGYSQQNQRNSFDGNFMRRGLMGSGIRQGALKDLYRTQLNASGDLANARQEALMQLAQKDANAQLAMQQRLVDIDAERQRQIYQQAAGLSAYR